MAAKTRNGLWLAAAKPATLAADKVIQTEIETTARELLSRMATSCRATMASVRVTRADPLLAAKVMISAPANQANGIAMITGAVDTLPTNVVATAATVTAAPAASATATRKAKAAPSANVARARTKLVLG